MSANEDTERDGMGVALPVATAVVIAIATTLFVGVGMIRKKAAVSAAPASAVMAAAPASAPVDTASVMTAAAPADAARIEADGRFELLARLDRIVKLEEKRISLPMLEQALEAHDWVLEARLGVVRENRASLGALLVLSDSGLFALREHGRRTLTQTLRQHLSQHCEALALPRRWRLLRQLPLTSQGKLAQAQVDALLLAPRPKQPEVLSQNQLDGVWTLRLAVPPDLAFFSGHFPTTPVLPGVVQVEWAMALSQQLLDLPPRFAGMEVLKFQQLVRPGDVLELTLRFDHERSKLHFAYRNATAPCSSGRIVLEPAHA